MADKSTYEYKMAMELFEERMLYWRNRATIAEEKVDKLTADLEKANAENTELVKRSVKATQAFKFKQQEAM